MSKAQDIFKDLFQNLTGQPATQESTSPTQSFDFSQVVEVPDDSYLDESTDDDNNQDVGFVTFNIPGFEEKTTVQLTESNQVTSRAMDFSSIFSNPQVATKGIQPSQSPHEGKPGRHPDGCQCSKHQGKSETVTDVVNQFPFSLSTPQEQTKSTGLASSQNIQTFQEGKEISISIDPASLLLIGEATETIGRTLKNIANQYIQASKTT